jgi:hypothetical protein
MKTLDGSRGGGPKAGSEIRYCRAKMNPRPSTLLAAEAN